MGKVGTVRWKLLTLSVLFMLLAVGCSGKNGAKRVSPTFTPVPRTPLPVGATAQPLPAQPVVSATCLRGLSSYRFTGTLSYKAAEGGAPAGNSFLSGSLANLLSNVSFDGAAEAPDRAQATVTLGGSGTQPLQIVRIGDQTYSRFGNAAWQKGDQIAGLGNIVQFDPESVCESSLTHLDGSGQTPVHETVNGVASLRYHFAGPQFARGLFGGDGESRAATATPVPAATAQAGNFDLTLWSAEKGGYPVRLQVAGNGEGTTFNFLINVSDLNGKDVQIATPR